MQHKKRIGIASLVALSSLAFAAPALAAGVTQQTTSVGNSTTIVSSGGTTTVTSSQSCSTGVTGYFYQSIRLLLGGSVVYVTQTATCR